MGCVSLHVCDCGWGAGEEGDGLGSGTPSWVLQVIVVNDVCVGGGGGTNRLVGAMPCLLERPPAQPRNPGPSCLPRTYPHNHSHWPCACA